MYGDIILSLCIFCNTFLFKVQPWHADSLWITKIHRKKWIIIKKGFWIAKIWIYFCFLLSMVFNRINAEVYPGIVWNLRFIIQWSSSGIIINHIYYIWQLDRLVMFISHESLWDYTTTCTLPTHHIHRSSYNIYFCKSLLWFTYQWKN